MIHITNYVNNIIYSAVTLPQNYKLILINNQNKKEYEYDMVNYLTTNTQSEITFTNLLPGEYIYRLESNGDIYEVGLAKLAPTTLLSDTIISHTSDIKYTIYGEQPN